MSGGELRIIKARGMFQLRFLILLGMGEKKKEMQHITLISK